MSFFASNKFLKVPCCIWIVKLNGVPKRCLIDNFYSIISERAKGISIFLIFFDKEINVRFFDACDDDSSVLMGVADNKFGFSQNKERDSS